MNSILSNNAASTNVTTSAYVQLTASSTTITSSLFVTDTTGSLIKIALGSAGHEVDLFQIPASRTSLIDLPSEDTIPLGSRISIKAIDTNATSGFTVVTLLS